MILDGFSEERPETSRVSRNQEPRHARWKQNHPDHKRHLAVLIVWQRGRSGPNSENGYTYAHKATADREVLRPRRRRPAMVNNHGDEQQVVINWPLKNGSYSPFQGLMVLINPSKNGRHFVGVGLHVTDQALQKLMDKHSFAPREQCTQPSNSHSFLLTKL